MSAAAPDAGAIIDYFFFPALFLVGALNIRSCSAAETSVPVFAAAFFGGCFPVNIGSLFFFDVFVRSKMIFLLARLIMDHFNNDASDLVRLPVNN